MNVAQSKPNPFRPGFGVSPAIIGNRSSITSEFRTGLHQGSGDPFRAMLISGPRGIGKTVLLNELEDCAQDEGWIYLRAQPFNLVDTLMNSNIPEKVLQVSQGKSTTRRISQVSIAGIGSVSTSTHEAQRTPEPTLNSELRKLLSILPPTSGLLLTIDEIQSASPTDLWQLTSTIQDLMRDALPIAFAADGLPDGIATLLSHDGTTFLRRATRVELKALDRKETARTLEETAELGGVTFDNAALQAAAALTRGYPYFVQLLGSLLWQRVVKEDRTSIMEDDVYGISEQAVTRLGQLVHAPAVRDLPDRELEYLTAMANLQRDLEAVGTAAIAEELGRTNKSVSMVRRRLLDRDLIYAPHYGQLNFVIPHLGHHLRAASTSASDWD